jgi:hypothetical protein
MPYLVLMCFSTANDNEEGEEGVSMERILDFQTEENYEMYEGDMFDNTLHIINDHLPDGVYIDDGFPEPVRMLGEVYTDEIDKETVIQIPLIDAYVSP